MTSDQKVPPLAGAARTFRASFGLLPRTTRRLVVAIGIPALILTVLAAGLSFKVLNTTLREEVDDGIRKMATSVVQAASVGAYTLDTEYLRSLADSVAEAPDVDFVEIEVSGLPTLTRGEPIQPADRNAYAVAVDIPPPHTDSGAMIGRLKIGTRYRDINALIAKLSMISVVFLTVMTLSLMAIAMLAIRRLALMPVAALADVVGAGAKTAVTPQGSESEIEAMLRFAGDQVVALVLSEQRSRLVVEAAQVGVFDTDFTTGTTIWNERLRHMLGLPGEARAMQFDEMRDLVDDDSRRRWIAAGRAAAAEAVGSGSIRTGNYTLEIDMRRRDGRVLTAQVNGAVIIGSDGKYLRSIGSVSDITAQKANEQKQAEAQRMETMGRLAGGIAHDFNNIVAAQRMFASLIVDSPEADAESRSYAKRIVASCNRATDLVRQIMMLYRATRAEHTAVSLHAILAEIQPLLRGAIRGKPKLQVHNARTDIVVKGNEGQIIQLLLNLGINAGDALTSNAGSIQIYAGAVQITRDNDPQLQAGVTSVITPPARGAHLHRCTFGSLRYGAWYGQLVVRDNGTGMSAETMRQMFEPFYTTKTNGRGSGLGLAVVASVVSAHGGAIIATSGLDWGTRVTVYLPCIEQPVVTADEKIDVDVAMTTQARVLIVDDEQDLADATAIGLRKRGFQTKQLYDAAEASAVFAGDPEAWDAAVVDQSMPHLDGLTLTARLKAMRPDLIVILCTGFSEVANEETALAAGATAFFNKPVSADELATALTAALPKRPNP